MSSVSQIAEALEQILNEEACRLARETGFIKRERTFDGADFAQSLIFAWLQEPCISLDGLIQVLGRREVELTCVGVISTLYGGVCHLFPTAVGKALGHADTRGGDRGLRVVATVCSGDRGGQFLHSVAKPNLPRSGTAAEAALAAVRRPSNCSCAGTCSTQSCGVPV